MNFLDSFKIAISSILQHKIRSILTMLGIIIGVGAVIIIVAIGEGAKKQLTDEMFNTDDNIIQLSFEPSFDEDGEEEAWVDPPEVTEEQLKQLNALPGVKVVLGTNESWTQLEIEEESAEAAIIGIDQTYFQAKDIQLIEGRKFNAADNDRMNRVVMIDSVLREAAFKEVDDVIGEIITLNDNPYKVIGVYQSTVPEEWISMGFAQGEMLMPRTLVATMFGTKEIENISVIGENAESLTETGTLVADKLTELQNLENGMYTTNDMSEFADEFNKFYTTITLFIGSIAGISLFVGGIGVMNIMLVSVTERTREIGLRKALGATRKQILLQFLIEAVTLTSLGGLIGISFATVVSLLLSVFLPFTAIINPLIVFIAFAFSAFIGVVFGILPANKASKLSPIDALRQE